MPKLKCITRFQQKCYYYKRNHRFENKRVSQLNQKLLIYPVILFVEPWLACAALTPSTNSGRSRQPKHQHSTSESKTITIPTAPNLVKAYDKTVAIYCEVYSSFQFCFSNALSSSVHTNSL